MARIHADIAKHMIGKMTLFKLVYKCTGFKSKSPSELPQNLARGPQDSDRRAKDKSKTLGTCPVK